MIFRSSILILAISAFGYLSISLIEQTQLLDRNPSEKKLHSADFQPKEGDIVFQSSMSGQSYAIQLATDSKYSHCGILLKDSRGKLLVAEAVQPVVFTPLEAWIERGDGNHCVVKRLKNSDEVLIEEVLESMRTTARSFMGKNYDLKFAWDDKELYCSELVWKIYERNTGIRLGEPLPMKMFNLEHPVVQEIMKKRYGKNIPYDMPMIAPSGIYDSEELITVNVY
jgi:hypothetical protein